MTANKAGQTEPPTETVPVTDMASLAEALKQTLEQDAPEQPDDAATEVVEEEGNEQEVVLSQPEEKREEAEAEPTADESKDETEGEPDEDKPADQLPRGVQKRINKLTARDKAKDEKIAELEAKLTEAQERASDTPKESVPSPPPDDNPFRALKTLKAVRHEELNAENILEWCDDNLEGAVVSTAEGETEYTAEEVRSIRRKASKALRRHLPEQKDWIAAHAATEPYIDAEFPWWKDKSTAEYQAAVQVMKEFPEIQRFPGYKVSIGDLVEGMKTRMAREANGKKGKKGGKVSPAKAPEQPILPAAEPAPMDERTVRSASARQRFNETGTMDDLANLLAAEMK